ncbi:MAG TPA: aquaporin [Chitinophagaceae bacterium]|nr:aquaporin [Chitinophagaceae bacterium]
MPIRVITGSAGWKQLKASAGRNWKHYLQEAIGLAIFMISACYFGALLESPQSALHAAMPQAFTRTVTMGLLMGSTALFIFYSPLTAPSGSQINPAVTLCFLRLGKMCHWDALFYIIFQFLGGTLAVYLMQWLMGPVLTGPPVNSVVTVPGKSGAAAALMVEFGIAFCTMMMILFTSDHPKFKKYTRILSGILVCSWVILAGPVSGFGMNPARSFASALPANTWTVFWIYALIPLAAMLMAAELFRTIKRNKKNSFQKPYSSRPRKTVLDPMEFVL